MARLKLSILICTTHVRTRTFLPALLDILEKQKDPYVEVLWLGDFMQMSVGEKRNRLMNAARGDFITFVDDDDRVTPDYKPQLLRHIDLGVDLVCFQAIYRQKGQPEKIVHYDANFTMDKNFPTYFERLPNHLMCVKRELALKVPFINKSFAEDQDYAKRLKSVLIKNGSSQVVIKKPLYYYDFSFQTSLTQGGGAKRGRR